MCLYVCRSAHAILAVCAIKSITKAGFYLEKIFGGEARFKDCVSSPRGWVCEGEQRSSRRAARFGETSERMTEAAEMAERGQEKKRLQACWKVVLACRVRA